MQRHPLVEGNVRIRAGAAGKKMPTNMGLPHCLAAAPCRSLSFFSSTPAKGISSAMRCGIDAAELRAPGASPPARWWRAFSQCRRRSRAASRRPAAPAASSVSSSLSKWTRTIFSICSCVREGDVVEDAAAQEGVGQLLFRVGRDDDDGALLCLDRLLGLGDVELHLVQLPEEVVGELQVGLVHLVDQQHHLLVGGERLAQLAQLDVLCDVVHARGRRTGCRRDAGPRRRRTGRPAPWWWISRSR